MKRHSHVTVMDYSKRVNGINVIDKCATMYKNL